MVLRIRKTEVSQHGIRDAAANWEDAHAKILMEHGFARGAASSCSRCWKERGIRVVVHGDNFLSGGPQIATGARESYGHFEAKHTVVGDKKSREVDCHAEQTNFMEIP